MNTTKKIIAVLIFISCSCFSYAQGCGTIDERDPKQRLAQQKLVISNSTFIFEGTVTNQKCYRQSPNGTILTCSTIEITKILKGSGQITLGTIKVITEQGGSIPEEHPNNEEYIAERGPIGGSLRIGKGTYIIFAPLADSSLLGSSNSPARTIATDNTVILGLYNVIGFDYASIKKHPNNPDLFPVVNWWGSKFQSKDELYTFLKDNGGLTVQEEKK
jgi:hypothetical protein